MKESIKKEKKEFYFSPISIYTAVSLNICKEWTETELNSTKVNDDDDDKKNSTGITRRHIEMRCENKSIQ